MTAYCLKTVFTSLALLFLLLDVAHAITVPGDGVQLTVMIDNIIYHQLFLEANRKNKTYQRLNKESGWPVNILMIMFDSQSSSNFERLLPNFVKTIRDHKTSFIMKGHTIVGDATTPQLTAILTGKRIEELPEARRGHEGAKSVDDWPMIYKDLSKNNYVTLHSEDDPGLGAFNLRLFGFENPPTDHYARAFWMATTNKEFVKGKNSCLLDKFMHNYHFNYVHSLYHKYPKEAKFGIITSSYLCHDEPNKVQYVDDDLTDFFTGMQRHGHLNNTFLVIFGDHGSRLGRFRNTIVGKMEERLPFMSITAPEWWESGYPNVIENLQHNSEILTSHFDIYATLQHLLSNLHKSKVNQAVGQSLLEKIDETVRTCEAAGIDEHWCPCLQYEEQNTTDSHIKELASSVVKYINNLTSSIPSGDKLCTRLQLKSIFRAGMKIANKKVQQFVDTSSTSKCDTCEAVLDKTAQQNIKTLTYELGFSVIPSEGTYEATVHVNNGKIVVDPNISRTNRYGSQPKCIQNEYPMLRKYCFCRKQ